jgi:hypothetical protein
VADFMPRGVAEDGRIPNAPALDSEAPHECVTLEFDVGFYGNAFHPMGPHLELVGCRVEPDGRQGVMDDTIVFLEPAGAPDDQNCPAGTQRNFFPLPGGMHLTGTDHRRGVALPDSDELRQGRDGGPFARAVRHAGLLGGQRYRHQQKDQKGARHLVLARLKGVKRGQTPFLSILCESAHSALVPARHYQDVGCWDVEARLDTSNTYGLTSW